MTNVSEWSVTAGLNNSSPPDGWPEGMARSAVNDAAREMMAALARWWREMSGVLTTGGSGDAYTLTTGSAHNSYTDVPLLVFRTDRGNTGPITLNVDGLGAFPVYRVAGMAYSNFALNDIFPGQVMVVVKNPGGWFDYVGPSVEGVDINTMMLFQQSAAPSGFVKQVTHDNKSLRVVTGTASSGGSTPFTSIFTSRIVNQANLPNVNFTNSLTAATHGHGAGTFSVSTSITNGTNVATNLSSTPDNTVQGGGARTEVASISFTPQTLSLPSGAVSGTSALSGALAVTGTVSSGGSGTALDFAVQYVDVIIAAKR
jgi:hypothetical protein